MRHLKLNAEGREELAGLLAGMADRLTRAEDDPDFRPYRIVDDRYGRGTVEEDPPFWAHGDMYLYTGTFDIQININAPIDALSGVPEEWTRAREMLEEDLER
jgi:hypothetical protein